MAVLLWTVQIPRGAVNTNTGPNGMQTEVSEADTSPEKEELDWLGQGPIA